MKAALVAADGTVTGWAERPVPLRVLPGGGAEQDPVAWWDALREVVADLGRAHPDTPAGDHHHLLVDPGRRHDRGGRERRAADPVHHVAGHARRGQPAPPVRRRAVAQWHVGAADRALAASDRRHAVADGQGPGRAHAADPRRDARGVRAHRDIPQRARLDQPEAHRPHGGHSGLDPDLVGHRQPARRPRSGTRAPWWTTAASTAPSCRRSSPAPRSSARSRRAPPSISACPRMYRWWRAPSTTARPPSAPAPPATASRTSTSARRRGSPPT